MNQIEETATSCLSDWPDGPLSGYRSRSSFNWKRLKLITEGEDELVTKVAIWKAMEGEPLFHRQPWDEPSRAEQRRLNSLRFLKTKELKFMDADKFDTNPLLIAPCHKAINQYDTCLLIKGTSARDTFITSARLSGSESQQQFVTDAINYEAFGCLVITELAHGSDTKRFNTRATFDPVRQEFVFNTPEIEATKVWSGNAAHLATHGNVFAQLYSPDGVCHGLAYLLCPTS
ncbi:Peroxisomal acyl-coenzyme A oxidase 3 [Halotydeus destructor]|nr:Peroxisomal acyl-coenzyme A oxidase 3 [Halotydeus destructor]